VAGVCQLELGFGDVVVQVAPGCYAAQLAEQYELYIR